MSKTTITILALLVAALAAGCGGDGDGAAAPCDEVTSAVCTAACNCTEGAACSITDVQGGGASITLDYDNRSACDAGTPLVSGLCTSSGDRTTEGDAMLTRLTCAECKDGDEHKTLEVPVQCD